MVKKRKTPFQPISNCLMLINCKIENYLIIITRHIHNDNLVHVKVGDMDYIDLYDYVNSRF